MQEEWKDIPEFEGIYQASTLGRIKGVGGRTTQSNRHGTRVWKEKIIKPKGTATRQSQGYRVSLYRDKRPYDFLVARLVASTFLDNNLHTKLTVNHKDGNRLNNNIDNLEWLSLADNIRHGMRTGLYCFMITTIVTEDGGVLVFNSMSEAGRFLGLSAHMIEVSFKKNKELSLHDGSKCRVISIEKRTHND